MAKIATAKHDASAKSVKDSASLRFLMRATASNRNISVNELAACLIDTSAPTKNTGIPRATAIKVITIEGLVIVHAVWASVLWPVMIGRLCFSAEVSVPVIKTRFAIQSGAPEVRVISVLYLYSPFYPQMNDDRLKFETNSITMS